MGLLSVSAIILVHGRALSLPTDIGSEKSGAPNVKSHVTESHASEPEPLARPVLVAPDQLTANGILSAPLNLDPKSAEDRQQTQLYQQARLYARQHNVEAATRCFVGILDGEASEDLKRASLLELAMLYEGSKQWSKAQQLFAQYLRRYPTDGNMPEILLRQGLLYREMGAPDLALSKFYAVMTGSLKLKFGNLDYYQRVVLQAQSEIAETHYLQGKFEEAAEFYSRLLKLPGDGLNKSNIHFKLIRSLHALHRGLEVLVEGKTFIQQYTNSADIPEVRFFLAEAYKKSGQKDAALEQVFRLLESQQNASPENAKNWSYWQQRAGNEIGNQLYQEGDFVSALQIYTKLAALNSTLEWQLPVQYQIGLIYERLQQPGKAGQIYTSIIGRQKELASKADPGLQMVCDMAQWRIDFIKWQTQLEQPASKQAANLPASSHSASAAQ
ncbi:MAG TPA: tetratricopeptide repeat protein [Verrucomicrobiae bacterium]|jgi:tetratricopeptide (TPR) repeat protein